MKPGILKQCTNNMSVMHGIWASLLCFTWCSKTSSDLDVFGCQGYDRSGRSCCQGRSDEVESFRWTLEINLYAISLGQVVLVKIMTAES